MVTKKEITAIFNGRYREIRPRFGNDSDFGVIQYLREIIPLKHCGKIIIGADKDVIYFCPLTSNILECLKVDDLHLIYKNNTFYNKERNCFCLFVNE